MTKKNKVRQETDDYLEKKIFCDCKEIIDTNNIEHEVAKAIILASIKETEEFSLPMRRLYNETNRQCPELFDIITREIFLNIIKHLKCIAHQKIENKPLGVNIIVFAKEDDADELAGYSLQFAENKIIGVIPDIQKHFIDNENELQRVYKCVDPERALFAYVCDNNRTLTLKNVKAFRGQSDMISVCDKNAVGFQLVYGLSCIRIYYQNNKIMDYYLSEITGEWTARFDNDIFKILTNLKIFSQEDAQLLTKISTRLACFGKGAMIIITSDATRFSKTESPCKMNPSVLKKAEENNSIYNYASYDGAVVLKYGDPKVSKYTLEVVNFGVILSPVPIPKNEYVYDILLKYTNSGSRHEKAVEYAFENPKDCIIVISENRTVSIIRGKKPLYWKDNPNPDKLVSYITNKENKDDNIKERQFESNQ